MEIVLETVRACSTVPFLAVCIFLLIERRYSFYSTLCIFWVSIVSILIFNEYFLIFYGIDYLSRIFPITVILPFLALTFLLSKYRDGRALFAGLTAGVLCLLGCAIGIFPYLFSHSLLLNLILKLIGFAVVLVFIVKVLRKPYFEIIHQLDRGWLVICSVPFMLLFSICLLVCYPGMLVISTGYILTLLFLIFAIVSAYFLIYFLFKQLQKQAQDEQNRQSLTLQSALLKKQEASILQSEHQTRIYHHDLRHYTRILISYLNTQRYEEALELTKTMDTLFESSKIEKFCSNLPINSILTTYINEARKNNIRVDHKLDLPQSLTIDALDLAVVFANAIENAIQACTKIPEADNRRLTLIGRQSGHLLIIQIKNTYTGSSHFYPDTLPPILDDEHGIGSRSIAAFAKKYDASLYVTAKNGWFELRILINLP
ncbi:MAG: GHKL domain-containing protein [Eubacterium sp.]